MSVNITRDDRAEQAVANAIEKWFKEGDDAAKVDAEKIIADQPLMDKQHTPCPYAINAPGRHWWARGYTYQARLLRCIAAETVLQACRDAAREIDVNVRNYLGPSR